MKNLVKGRTSDSPNGGKVFAIVIAFVSTFMFQPQSANAMAAGSPKVKDVMKISCRNLGPIDYTNYINLFQVRTQSNTHYTAGQFFDSGLNFNFFNLQVTNIYDSSLVTFSSTKDSSVSNLFMFGSNNYGLTTLSIPSYNSNSSQNLGTYNFYGNRGSSGTETFNCSIKFTDYCTYLNNDLSTGLTIIGNAQSEIKLLNASQSHDLSKLLELQSYDIACINDPNVEDDCSGLAGDFQTQLNQVDSEISLIEQTFQQWKSSSIFLPQWINDQNRIILGVQPYVSVLSNLKAINSCQ